MNSEEKKIRYSKISEIVKKCVTDFYTGHKMKTIGSLTDIKPAYFTELVQSITNELFLLFNNKPFIIQYIYEINLPYRHKRSEIKSNVLLIKNVDNIHVEVQRSSLEIFKDNTKKINITITFTFKDIGIEFHYDLGFIKNETDNTSPTEADIEYFGKSIKENNEIIEFIDDSNKKNHYFEFINESGDTTTTKAGGKSRKNRKIPLTNKTKKVKKNKQNRKTKKSSKNLNKKRKSVKA